MLGGLRLWPERKSTRAAYIVAGLAAFVVLAFTYVEYRNGYETPVPGCDVGLCSKPVTTVTITNSKPEEMTKPQASPPVAPDIEPGNHPDEAPVTGPMQRGDKLHQPAPRRSFPPGIVASRKTGARARVGVAYAARFQAYLDDLETNHGARIIFIGGIRPGRCASSSLHPCGKALDVCQLSRGVVDSRCHMPPRRQLAQIASSHGLFEGGRWCNSDYGHAQVGDTAGDCGHRRTYTARRRFLSRAGAFSSFR